MRTQVFLFSLAFFFLSVLNAQGQDSFDSCMVHCGERHILFNKTCQISAADVIKDLPSYIFEEGKDQLVLKYVQRDSIANSSITHYQQRRYGYNTSGYLRIYETESVVTMLIFNHKTVEVDTIAHDFIDVYDALSALQDSLLFGPYSWEPFSLFGDTVQFDRDTTVIVRIVYVDTTISVNDTMYILNYSDTIWQDCIGDYAPKIDTILNSDSINGPIIDFLVQFRLRNRIGGIQLVLDAITGNVKNIKTRSQFSSIGTGETLYNGTQEFYTKWTGPYVWNGYILKDDNRGQGIQTKMYDSDPFPHNVRSQDSYWDGNFIEGWTEYQHRMAISAHWAIEKSWDYFNDVFSMTSIDDGGIKINTILDNFWADIPHFPPGYTCNAAFDPTDNIIRIGKGRGGSELNTITCSAALTLDILGHEYTHGISKFAIEEGEGFDYEGESGALDESFSDIFGCMIEYYTTESESNWHIGD